MTLNELTAREGICTVISSSNKAVNLKTDINPYQIQIAKTCLEYMGLTMYDVRSYFLGPRHSTAPAAVTTNKNIKVNSFKSSENIQKKEVEHRFFSL